MSIGRHVLSISALIVILFALGSWSAPNAPDHQQAARSRIALIVAIGDYGTDTGYSSINSLNDVPLVMAGLEAQGFRREDIFVLPQEEATVEGIGAAFQTHLIDRARPGDIAVFHYSGHGHRITDNGSDEPDGYDEVLVPVDAPNIRQAPAGYAGERHLRDDDLGAMITRLRERLTSTGELLVTIDACFSGSATRAQQVLGVRGVMEPIGPPAGGRTGRDEAGGFFEQGPATTRGVGDDLAPYVVISASRHDQLNFEMRTDDGTVVGPLSYALGRTLSRMQGLGSPTYRMLFEEIKGVMAGKVRLQEPQVEGDLDRKIFNGEFVTQEPYFDVVSHVGRDVVIEGGHLHGIFEGSTVEFHEQRTVNPAAVAAVARGTVRSAGSITAEIELDAASERSLDNLLAFVTEYSFPSMGVSVWISDVVQPDVAVRLGAEVSEISALSIADARATADLVIDTMTSEDGPGTGVVVRTATDYGVIGGPYAATAVDEIVERARLFSLNGYLRNLGTGSKAAVGFSARLEFVPARSQPDHPLGCVPDERRRGIYAKAGGGVALRSIDPDQDPESDWAWYKLRIHNQGDSVFYATVLDLMPDGTIAQLFPHQEARGADNQVQPGTTYEVPLCYFAIPPLGQEVLKLMATASPVSFESVVTQAGLRRDSGGTTLDPLEQFGATLPRTRNSGQGSSTFTVNEITLTILPRAGDGR